MGVTTEIGNLGERAATKYLRENGYLIMERNWRAGSYELDIIAQRWDTVHFIEVKTRSANSWDSPEDAMTSKKIESLRRAMRAYLAYRPTDLNIQLDLIAIELRNGEVIDIRYIENII